MPSISALVKLRFSEHKGFYFVQHLQYENEVQGIFNVVIKAVRKLSCKTLVGEPILSAENATVIFITVTEFLGFFNLITN